MFTKRWFGFVLTMGAILLTVGLVTFSVSAETAAPSGTPLSSIKQISTSYGHTCALTHDGKVFCWGHNSNGELGDGTTNTVRYPKEVLGLSDITVIETSPYRTCALNTLGGLKCWGQNAYGSLGDGTDERRMVPTQVIGLESGVVSFSSGFMHACAVLQSGDMKCWGRNDEGQLGLGYFSENQNVPGELTLKFV